MKKLFFPLLAFALLFTSCTELSKLTQFDLPFTSTVSLPAIPVVPPAPLLVSTPQINTEIGAYMTKNGIDAGSIQKITLKSLELSINTPATANFNFLKTLEIYLVDGTTEVKIATLTTVPVSALTTIPVNVESVDLKQYVLKENFALKFKIEADETTSSDIELTVKPIFLIDLKVLGL
jgi:hypothetical protein